MKDELGSIIQDLCEKLHVDSANIISEFTKYSIAKRGTDIALCLIIILLATIGIKRTNNMLKNGNVALDVMAWLSVLGGVVIVGCIIVIIMDVSALSGWIASPTASTVKYILELLK